MAGEKKIIVVGTTPDYVIKLFSEEEGLICLLDSSLQAHPLLKRFGKRKLIFAPLDSPEETIDTLKDTLKKHGIVPNGIACFDCERLVLTSRIAKRLGQRFPNEQGILNSRNKALSKMAWKQAGIQTPNASIAQDLEGSIRFYELVQKDVILKPLSASGGELIFHCKSKSEIVDAVRTLKESLSQRWCNPLFERFPSTSIAPSLDPCSVWLVEEFIKGPEFSCDYILGSNELSIVRITGKIKPPDKPAGMIPIYLFPPDLPPEVSVEALKEILVAATKALGFDWGYFMADFIICDGSVYLLEITPRPGGDSIPRLIEAATEFDVLKNYLRFMASGTARTSQWTDFNGKFASIPIYSEAEGVITWIDTSLVASLPKVISLHLVRDVGNKITLPPKDYDSRILAYAIVHLTPGESPISLQRSVQSLFRISTSRPTEG